MAKKIKSNAKFCPYCGTDQNQNVNTNLNTHSHYINLSNNSTILKGLSLKQKRMFTVIICILVILVSFGWHYHSTHYLPYSISNQNITLHGFGNDVGDKITYHMHSKSFTISDDDDDTESYSVKHVSKSDYGKRIVVSVSGKDDDSTYTKFTFNKTGDRLEVNPSGNNDD